MIRMIRQERIKRGWSIDFVAEKAGLSDEAIRLIETGERNPSYPVLVKLEDLFHMGHRELFETASGVAVSEGEPDGNPAQKK